MYGETYCKLQLCSIKFSGGVESIGREKGNGFCHAVSKAQHLTSVSVLFIIV